MKQPHLQSGWFPEHPIQEHAPMTREDEIWLYGYSTETYKRILAARVKDKCGAECPKEAICTCRAWAVARAQQEDSQ